MLHTCMSTRTNNITYTLTYTHANITNETKKMKYLLNTNIPLVLYVVNRRIHIKMNICMKLV